MQSTPLAMLVMFVFALFAEPSVGVDQKLKLMTGHCFGHGRQANDDRQRRKE